MSEEEQSQVDWKTEVDRYSDKSREHAERVWASVDQVRDNPDQATASFRGEQWEAVYTLVRQREQMEGASG